MGIRIWCRLWSLLLAPLCHSFIPLKEKPQNKPQAECQYHDPHHWISHRYSFLLPIQIQFLSSLTSEKHFRQQKIHGTISTVPGPSSPCGSWQLAEPRHVSAGLPSAASSSGAQPTERHQGPSEAVGACKAAWLQPSSRGRGPSRLGNTSLLFVCHVSAGNFETKTKQNKTQK